MISRYRSGTVAWVSISRVRLCRPAGQANQEEHYKNKDRDFFHQNSRFISLLAVSRIWSLLSISRPSLDMPVVPACTPSGISFCLWPDTVIGLSLMNQCHIKLGLHISFGEIK